MSEFSHGGGSSGGSVAAAAIPLGVYPCMTPIQSGGTTTMSPAVVTTALVPTFHMIEPPVAGKFIVSQMGLRVGTGSAATTAGIAVYQISWTGVGTFTASIVCQLNAALSTASGAAIFYTDSTSGAAGSGASTAALDFTAHQYMVGSMASVATTLTIDGMAGVSKMGALVLTSAARSSTTDWPATITDSTGATAGAIGNTNRLNATFLVNADGKNYL